MADQQPTATDSPDPLSGAADPFADLVAANAAYSADFSGEFDGIARAGVAVVTCMDSRIDPLHMIGLAQGDAKIFRNPGGRVTEAALEALVLGVHLLNVQRILVVPHTRCAMALNTEQDLQVRIGELAGQDVSWHAFHVVTDQQATLRADVRRITSHPLIPETVAVGGFMYDVDTGALHHVV
ncbi:MAG: carbonic anhydrase [Nocardioides sp.]